MDKYNDKGKRIENQEVERVIRTQKERLIQALEDRGVLERKRVVKDVGVLVQAFYHYITENWSFRTLARHMAAKYDTAMSDTAWRKQFTKTAAAFLEAAMEISRPASADAKSTIYALDSTNLPMEGGNGTAIRIHTCYAVNGESRINCKVTDVHTAESVRHFPIQAGSLYLADRGYGRSKQIAYVLENGADFLFRISPKHIRLYHNEKCSQRLDIDSLLQQRSFDQKCYVKVRKKAYLVRLIGQKLPHEKMERAEKKFVESPTRTVVTFSKAPSIMPNGCFC